MSRSGGGFSLVRIGVPVAEGSLNLELFRGYELEAGSYDEVFASRGVPRPARGRSSERQAGLAGPSMFVVGSRRNDFCVRTVSSIPISVIRQRGGVPGN